MDEESDNIKCPYEYMWELIYQQFFSFGWYWPE